MISKLQNKFDGLNKSLEQTLDYMDSLSDEKLNQNPPDAWSAVQILQHLMESEKGTTTYLSKKVLSAKSEVQTGGLGSKIRSFLLSRALRNYNKKFKVPSALKGMVENPDYTEVKTEYLETRKKMALILEKFDKDMLGKAYFKHPRAGRITIVQTLGFLKDHFDRHEKQIKERSS